MLAQFSAIAQSKLYISAVAGTYRMSDMKAFQEELRESADFLPMEIVSSFPPSLQADAALAYRAHRTRVPSQVCGATPNVVFRHRC